MSLCRTIATLSLAALMVNASAQSILRQAEDDEIVYMSREEPAMRKAFERARATLDGFLRIAASPPEGTSSYGLKVAVSDGTNTEYFWVNRFANSGKTFTAHLGNEPRLVKKYKFGERFTFRREQIVDWTYYDAFSKRTVGNFTACALLTRESPEDAKAFKQQYGLSCD